MTSVDDLTVQVRDQNDNLTGSWRYLEEGEFDRIAREEGYIKKSEAFDVWANTPINEIHIELEDDED